MVVHNFITVDGTEYLLLAMVEKGGRELPPSSLS